MNYSELNQKKYLYDQLKKDFSSVSVNSFEKSFEIEYTHNSTAIEGNTLTLIETKVVLEEMLSIGGKNLRELYEVINHHKAFQMIKKCISEGILLNENVVKDIHSMLMENILIGGVYRNVDVKITGSKHKPPTPNEMYIQIKNFFSDLTIKNDLNPIELAAWTHAEFVKIHPFEDGNGRTARLIMNYQLMTKGYLPISIMKENRLDYFNNLEEYATQNSIERFVEMIMNLEIEQLDEYLKLAKNYPYEIGLDELEK